MVMRRYISHLFTWVISFLTLLAFSSCLNEHPKDQLDGGGRAEYNMVRAHVGLPARKSSLANILEDRQVVLAGETCHRQDLIRFGKFLKSSHLRRSVQSALSSSSIVFPIPQRSLAFNGKLVQNKGYEAME